MDFAFPIVGFDLDGTLVDTSEDLTAAVNHVLREAGRPVLPVDRIRPMIGGGAKHMLKLGLAESGGVEPEEGRRLYKAMLRHYEENLSVYSEPYPGAVAALHALRARGVRCAVVTNKFELFANRLLGDLDLLDQFDTVIGGDTLGKGNAKPSAAPIEAMIERLGGGRAVFIGDSSYDIMAAKNAGIASVAVRFGFAADEVDTFGADAIIDDYAALIPTLLALPG